MSPTVCKNVDRGRFRFLCESTLICFSTVSVPILRGSHYRYLLLICQFQIPNFSVSNSPIPNYQFPSPYIPNYQFHFPISFSNFPSPISHLFPISHFSTSKTRFQVLNSDLPTSEFPTNSQLTKLISYHHLQSATVIRRWCAPARNKWPCSPPTTASSTTIW